MAISIYNDFKITAFYTVNYVKWAGQSEIIIAL